MDYEQLKENYQILSEEQFVKSLPNNTSELEKLLGQREQDLIEQKIIKPAKEPKSREGNDVIAAGTSNLVRRRGLQEGKTDKLYSLIWNRKLGVS